MLVNEPFNRDPDMPMKKINARRYDMTPRPSLSSPIDDSRSASPTPYSTPSVGNLRDKFYGAADQTFKKRSAPKPPVYNDQFEQRPAKKAPAPPRPLSPYKPPKVDPIKEMVSYAKKDV